MTHRIRRRGLLAGATLLALPAGASAQTGMEEMQGALTAANAARFAAFVADRVDRVVSLRLTAAAAPGPGYMVDPSQDLLIVNVPGQEPVQVSVRGGWQRQGGGYAVDGVFAVSGAGMQQGILIYVLDPIPAARARAAREGAVRRVTLG